MTKLVSSLLDAATKYAETFAARRKREEDGELSRSLENRRTVGVNVTTYVDATVMANQTYIYRVKATNPFGSSAYTPEAAIIAR